MDSQTSLTQLLNKNFISMQTELYKYSALDIIVNLSASLIAGIFIYYIYIKTFSGVLYQKTFNTSLVLITLIVTLMIMTISGNLVLSLGLVGALSIVRFRTPIKDPIDLVFIFWAITVGIANGVGYFNLSLIGSLFITITLFIISKKDTTNQSYLLILKLQKDTNENTIQNYLKKYTKAYQLKSNTINNEYKEAIYELKLKNTNQLLQELNKQNNILKATLISYNNELKYV